MVGSLKIPPARFAMQSTHWQTWIHSVRLTGLQTFLPHSQPEPSMQSGFVKIWGFTCSAGFLREGCKGGGSWNPLNKYKLP